MRQITDTWYQDTYKGVLINISFQEGGWIWEIWIMQSGKKFATREQARQDAISAINSRRERTEK